LRLGHVKSSPPDVPCWRCVPAGASGQSEKRQDVACDCLCSPSDTAINWASAIGPRDGNGVRAIGRLLPRPHAWRSRLSFFFCKEGDNRTPAIPRMEHTDRNRKMAKNRTAPISGRGFCRVDVERGHLSDLLQIGREEGQVATGVLCTRETV
jgi:hypothetical protein